MKMTIVSILAGVGVVAIIFVLVTIFGILVDFVEDWKRLSRRLNSMDDDIMNLRIKIQKFESKNYQD